MECELQTKRTKYAFDIYLDSIVVESFISHGGNNLYEVVSLYTVPLSVKIKDSWREHMASIFSISRSNNLDDAPFCDVRVGIWS